MQIASLGHERGSCQIPASPRLAALPAAVAFALSLDDRSATHGVEKEALGKRLERLRRNRDLTLAHFADVIGVSKPTVWAWGNGKCRPRTHRIAAITEALGIDPEELTDAALASGQCLRRQCCQYRDYQCY